MQVPFHVLKKVAVLANLSYAYTVDHKGYGTAVIDGITISFYMDQDGYINLSTVRCI